VDEQKLTRQLNTATIVERTHSKTFRTTSFCQPSASMELYRQGYHRFRLKNKDDQKKGHLSAYFFIEKSA